MKINPFLFQTKIKNVPYLLPYGQGISDFMKSIHTNESGILLWEGLLRGEDRDALLERLCDFYKALPEEKELLAKDLDEFLQLLDAEGVIKESSSFSNDFSSFSSSVFEIHHAQIGPLLLSMQLPTFLFQQYFSAFEAQPDSACKPDLRLRLLPGRPLRCTVGEILVRSDEMLIADSGEDYLFLPLQSRFTYEMRVSKDGSDALLYCRYEEADKSCPEELFHMIRFAFLVTAQAHGLCVLHSASLLYGGEAWLFSGHSGAGKSTHTKLWRDGYSAPLLNGDLNLLGIKNGQPFCYGLPWCGTSGICTAENHPLGGVVFLKQAPHNKIIPLTADREILFLTQRMITPSWTKSQLQKNLELAEALAGSIRIFGLECTKQPEAADVIRDAIDNSSKNH